MATLPGIAFFSHQLGSFLGAYGGGLIYSALGSYEWAWKGAVAIGIAAGLFQMTMNVRPSARVLAERSGAGAPGAEPDRRLSAAGGAAGRGPDKPPARPRRDAGKVRGSRAPCRPRLHRTRS